MQPIDRLLDLAALPASALPDRSRAMARFSFFDWIVCGRAGRTEPLARILRDMIATEGGQPVAAVIGGGAAPARAAALVNGATSHALDYDDTHFAHVGHPSVAIYPAALAVAEDRADVAALDCRSWSLFKRFCPEARKLSPVGWTSHRKGLPHICAADLPLEIVAKVRAVLAG